MVIFIDEQYAAPKPVFYQFFLLYNFKGILKIMNSPLWTLVPWLDNCAPSVSLRTNLRLPV